MKKIILTMVAISCAISGYGQTEEVCVQAGKPEADVVLKISVEAVHERFFAGPYAKYAQKYLGVDARQNSSNTTRLKSVSLSPAAIDPEEELVYEFGGTLPDKADFSAAPLLRSSVGQRSVEMAASMAADQIMTIRQKRHQILTGDTDMSLSGESLRLTLEEFSRQEDELLKLFLGYTLTDNLKGDFTVVPTTENVEGVYVAFRVSDNGILPANHLEGRMVTVEVTPTNLPEKTEEPVVEDGKKKKKAPKGMEWTVRREFVPAECSVRLRDGMTVLLQGSITVPQLGYVNEYEELAPVPVKKKAE